MKLLPDWKLYSLEMDDAGKTMGKFFEKQGYAIRRVKINEIGLHKEYKKILAENVDKSLQQNRRAMVVYGDNGFHHYTYGLVKFADRFSDEFGYIHIDNHCDCYRKRTDSWLTCGNFVGQIADDTHVNGIDSRIMFIGSNPQMAEASSFYGLELKSDAFMKTLEKSLEELPSQAYVSIDLDILKTSEIITSYSQGFMDKSCLLEILSLIKGSKQLIGADVIGFKGGLLGWLLKGRAQKLYRDIIDIITE